MTSYANGYRAAIDDTLTALRNNIEARRDIYRQQHWPVCISCNGDGENHQPKRRDIVLALARDAGASCGLEFPCEQCGGEGFERSIEEIIANV